MLRWIKGVTLRNTERERNENVEVDQGCDTKGHRERGMRMLRWINGVTLRNTERERNENVEVDQGCDTKEQREREREE